MIQCKKNLTLFRNCNYPVAKNSALSLSKYSIPKLAYKVDHDMIKCFLGRLRLYDYYVISKIVRATHTKDLLVTNLV